MGGSLEVTGWVALGAGLVSFASPCVLPLVPTYMTYLTGVSLDELVSHKQINRASIFANALAFVLGFSVVFVLLGLSASFVGQFLLQNQPLFRKFAGVVIVLLGLHIAGVFRFLFLLQEKRWNIAPRRIGVLNSLLVGVAFSFGWTPCIGPILGAILMVAGTEGSTLKGALLLALYSVGLAIPFLIAALGMAWVLPLLKRIGRYMRVIEITSGVLLVVVGVMVYTDYFFQLAGFIR